MAQTSQALSLQDILIWQLIEEVHELMARGLRRAYLRRHEALASPRGRIDFRTMANRAPSTETTLPCVHYRRDQDGLINRVLLSGLRLAAALATDHRLRMKAGRLVSSLREGIAPIRLDRQVFQRLAGEMDRMTKSYEPAISLIRILHEAGGLTLSEGKTGPEVPGFLFDMNRFFQTVLEKFLSENLTDYLVHSEHRLMGMFAYMPGWNPRRSQVPTPRPDLVVSQAGEPVAILDAKYRDLWENALTRDMLYQLSIYAMSHDGGTATILYPTTHHEATEGRIEIRQPLHGGRRALVVVRPVNLARLARLVTARASTAALRERRSYALQLAFGSST